MADSLKDVLKQSAAPQPPKLPEELRWQHQADALECMTKITQAEARLKARELRDRFRQVYHQMPPVQIPKPTAADFSTPDLVMEMLSRGYAVIKMPEDGSLPDVLK